MRFAITDFALRSWDRDASGTLIEGKIGRIGKARFFVVFWFAFLSLFVAVGISSWLIADAPFMFAAMFVGIPGIMMVMGGWLFSRSARRGPEDERRILAFLTDKVDARPAGLPD